MAGKILNIAFKVKITGDDLQDGGYFRFIDFGISSANLEKSASQLASDWKYHTDNKPYFYKNLFADFQKRFPELGDEQKSLKLASIGRHLHPTNLIVAFFKIMFQFFFCSIQIQRAISS